MLLVFGGKTQVLIDVFGLLATRLRLLSSACVGRREWRGRHQAVPAAPPTAARRRCRGGGGIPGAELTNILGEWAAHAFTWQTAEEPVAVGERAGQDGAARADGWRRLVCGCGEYNMIKKLAPHRPLQNCPLSQRAHLPPRSISPCWLPQPQKSKKKDVCPFSRASGARHHRAWAPGSGSRPSWRRRRWHRTRGTPSRQGAHPRRPRRRHNPRRRRRRRSRRHRSHRRRLHHHGHP